MPRGAKPGERRGGRKKGTPNKLTAKLKDTILQALANVGGVEYLESCATQHPTAFLALIGRVLPLQVKQDDVEPTVPIKTIVHEHKPATGVQ